MFPLKRRRKFARINKNNFTCIIVHESNEYTVDVRDISANGCNVDDTSLNIAKGTTVTIKFFIEDLDVELEAVKVRPEAYNFKFETRELQSKLNNIILTEYFNDTPELIPVYTREKDK